MLPDLLLDPQLDFHRQMAQAMLQAVSFTACARFMAAESKPQAAQGVA